MLLEGNTMKANGRSIWVRIGVIVLTLGCGLGVPAYGFASGTGEPNNPYQIATAADLLSINSDINLLKKSFVLLNDLDLDPNLPGGQVFTDAVISKAFWGTFDGRGHAIRHLCASAKEGHSAGLFGSVHGLIKDLHLKDVQISGLSCGALASFTPEAMILHCSVTGKVAGTSDTGGLIGNAWDAKILYCESQADVSGTSSVGGLVGHTITGAQIGDSRASGTVTGTSSVGGLLGSGTGTVIAGCTAACKVAGTDQVGGLVGGVSFLSTILHCESRADVSAAARIGGLAGWLYDSQMVECRAAGTVAGTDSVGGLVGSSGMATIRGCVAVCEVTAQQAAGGLTGDIQGGVSVVDSYARGSVAGSVAGGLAGNAATVGFPTYVLNSYAACEMLGLSVGKEVPVVGGLFGKTTSSAGSFTAAACFWDAELSKIPVGIGSGPAYSGTGLATKQMQQQDTFKQAGWDFDSTWAMQENGYPVLQWELVQDAGQKP
jgi:hypothetical protein